MGGLQVCTCVHSSSHTRMHEHTAYVQWCVSAGPVCGMDGVTDEWCLHSVMSPVCIM